MGTTMNRKAYELLIEQNIEWVKRQEQSPLEQEHIIRVLRWSVDQLYPHDTAGKEG